MTNEEAIKEIQRWLNGCPYADTKEAFNLAIKALEEKTQGDLISREALKKALKSNCDLCHDKNTNWCEHCCPLNDFEDLIDNAPTVYPICEDKACKYRANERPQGEWNYIQAGMCVCPFCGAIPHKLYKNYCAKCGAKMKGGAE